MCIRDSSLYALMLILILLMVGCKSWRPFFKIDSLCCVSTFVMPAYLGVSGASIAAYYLAPSADVTTDDQETFISYLQLMGFGILGLHTFVFAPARLFARRSIARWQALVFCEIGKGLLCVTIVLGIDSLGSVASSSFIFFGILAVVSALTPLIARLATVCKLCICSQEGFELQRFYQTYFGVEPENQQPPLWGCESSSVGPQEQAGEVAMEKADAKADVEHDDSPILVKPVNDTNDRS
eukprot:TRINITY_DN10059_c0_g1_i1.p1 TRINITY_DN10059_c0_g1~~TRINITY_DN10059_c0_g1_i1.p1  ORF type:complete len:239 (+),score=39.56 TRINITY_DN10059_c0_g1_i1:121-837(+)